MSTRTIIALLIALLIIGAYIFWGKEKSPAVESPVEEEVACTREAKICPDGTEVGRVAPSCEFAPCPEPQTPVFEDGTL